MGIELTELLFTLNIYSTLHINHISSGFKNAYDSQFYVI